MRVIKAPLQKLAIKFIDNVTPIEYYLNFPTASINLNQLLGKKISLQFTNNINCIKCNRSIRKTYNNGFCYVCFMKLAACDTCIMRPSLCHHHLGTCRQPEWGLENCMQPHILYLAETSSLKIGLTKVINVPGRWLDQGAKQAVAIMQVESRLHAGLIEELIATQISDKTNWREMLLNYGANNIDLLQNREKIVTQFITQIQHITLPNPNLIPTMKILPADATKIYHIAYPKICDYQNVNSMQLLKEPIIEGTLLGIKGQYLILDTGVFNVWRHSGFEVKCMIN